MLDINQIKESIPQRFPYLMVDRIIYLDEGKKVVGIKNISINEPYFQGHFPVNPVLPGTVILEAMAQTSTFLFYSKENSKVRLNFYLGVIKNARFYKTIIPGDQLKIEAKAIRLTTDNACVSINVFVEEAKVCESEMIFVRGK